MPLDERRAFKETIDKAVRNRHQGAEPSDPPEPDSRRIKPWWRRARDFIVDGHKLVVAIASICAATIGVHVWLKSLVSERRVQDVVVAAVTKALLETNGRVSTLEDRTSGLPDWRVATIAKMASDETRLMTLEHRADNVDKRFDAFMIRR